MPLSNELVLGFPLDAGIGRLSADSGVPIAPFTFRGQQWEIANALHEALEPLRASMDPALADIHRQLIEHRFGPSQPDPTSYSLNHITAATPAGPRTFAPFRLNTYFDPEEAGHEPADYAIGVALASRYFPVFVDWRDEHGTSGSFRFDAELAAMVAEARAALAARWPSFADAELRVIPVWY